MKIAAFALNGSGYFGQAAGRIGGASQQGREGGGNKVLTMLDNLRKQKENIIENKNDLIGRTMENGSSISSISDQLEGYEEQLKNIDEQISQAMLDEQNNKLNPDKKESGLSGTDHLPVSDEDAQNQNITDMLTLSTDIDKAKQFEALKSRMESRVGILESEIKLDRGRTQSAQKSFDKSDMVRELKSSIKDISEQSGEVLAKINDTIHDLSQSVGGAIKKPEADRSEMVIGPETENPGSESAEKDRTADIRSRETKVWESKIDEYKTGIYKLSDETKTNRIIADA